MRTHIHEGEERTEGDGMCTKEYSRRVLVLYGEVGRVHRGDVQEDGEDVLLPLGVVQEEGAHDCQVVGEDGEAQWAHQGVGLLRYGSN